MEDFQNDVLNETSLPVEEAEEDTKDYTEIDFDAIDAEIAAAEEAAARPAAPKKKKGWLIALIAVIVVLAAAAAVFFRVGDKFQDVTVEAGTTQVSIDGFLKMDLYKEFSKFISGTESIDLNKAGDYPITLSMAGKEETVTLHVVDTTPPTVEFTDITRFAGYELDVSDFVVSVEDYSDTTSEFVGTLPDMDKYATNPVTVRVCDAYGNETVKECMITISWLKSEAEIQIGNEDFVRELVADPEKDIDKIPADILAAVDYRKLGDYEFSVDYEGTTFNCKVSVIDTTPPELTLKSITVYDDDTKKYAMKDFIESVSDNSLEVDTTMTTELKFSGTGTQTVTIRAVDPSGNVTEASTEYIRRPDTDPPRFSGLTKMSVPKNGSPNYEKGVSAKDEKDGTVEFTLDSSKVKLDTAGTYVVTYTAKDKAGNVGTGKRQVEVQHDSNDTAALVTEVAKKVGNSIKNIRDFVRSKVTYSHVDGGKDPVWYGFTTWTGDCTVKASCYCALLREKGYDAIVIHDNANYHYWVMIYTNGQWWHSDPGTSSQSRSLPLLATDEERSKCLFGYDWDRTQYPAAP